MPDTRNIQHHGELRYLTVPPGTLLGFKAAPRLDCDELFSHAENVPATTDWSAIYVQLHLGQAIRYVPNQFERGQEIACVVALRTLQPMKIVVCSDPRMSDATISSHDKANIVRKLLLSEKQHQTPLLAALGEKKMSLCLQDSEDYELAVPHSLFNRRLLQPETILTLEQSKKIPCTIGTVNIVQPEYHAVLEPALCLLSQSDIADAADLSNVVTGAILNIVTDGCACIITTASWLQNDAPQAATTPDSSSPC